MLVQDDLFPLKISLTRPRSSEVNESFAEIAQWIRMLKAASKPEIGYGYELLEKTILNRQSGRNQVPTHAVIPTMQDALKLLNKQHEAEKFLQLTQEIQSKWPALSGWIEKHPYKVLAVKKDWQSILAVLQWFSDHPNSGLYLRQLDIAGIDTKFIEHKKGLLNDLLNLILPESSVDHEASSFEQRFGLHIKPTLIRFRILDHNHFIQGVSDFTIPVKQFAAWNLPVSRIFITENEINGLCFPNVKNGLTIFKMGYGINVLKNTEWLKDKEIYYWGDIDTHGFAILDHVRSFLPQTQSIMMDKTTLLTHRDMWCTEEKPFLGQLNRLTDDEYQLFCRLKGNAWGEGVRLEQERIKFSTVKHTVKQILIANSNQADLR